MTTKGVNIGETVAAVLKAAPGATHVLVGPPLVYRDPSLSVMVTLGRLGRRSFIAEVDLGEFVPPVPAEIAAAVDTVVMVTRPGQITMDDAHELRRSIAADLREWGLHVELFDSEDDAIEVNARMFPSPAATKLLADHRAEMAAREASHG